MQKYLVANWKENPASETKALTLFSKIVRAAKIKNSNVIICPPFIYLEKIAARSRALKANVNLGAQDIFWEEKGAFTGEIGPKMLRSLGVKYVIVGHSESRKYLKETDAAINKKIKLALQDGLKVILCVGESLPIRRKGTSAAKNFIKKQLKAGLRGVATKRLKKGALMIAYEPIWAIGSGKTDSPVDAVEMADVIKKTLKSAIPVLYGGSTNAKNIADFVQYKEIAGALVGGASLKAEEFGKMIKKLY